MSKMGRIYYDPKRDDYRVVFGRDIRKRFKHEDDAIVFLTALRYQQDTGTLDPRDHHATRPLAISKQAALWLATKTDVCPKYLRQMERCLEAAADAWKDRNVKHITTGDIEDFLLAQPVGNKTRHDMANFIGQFFRWVCRRERFPMPEIPEIEYTLGWREIITLETQAAILDEVKRIAPHRIWLGVKWLATYLSIRPGEMRMLRERDVNAAGMIVCRGKLSKDGQLKVVPMIEEDIELVRALPRGMPDLWFFRNDKGTLVGERAMYNAWIAACKVVGVTGVDLYGGTRHSSTSAMAAIFTKEELKEHGTLHGTNKAFERYCQKQAEPSRKIYEKLAEKRSGVAPVLPLTAQTPRKD